MFAKVFGPDSVLDRPTAEVLAGWSTDEPSVLTVEAGTLQAYPLNVVVCADEALTIGQGMTRSDAARLVIGHVAVNEGLIRTMMVAKAARGQQAAPFMLDVLLRKIPEELPELETVQAFANDSSLRVLKRLGGRCVGLRDEPAPTGCKYVVDLSSVVARTRELVY